MKWAKEDKNKKYVILITGIVLLSIGLTFFPLNNGRKSQPVSKVIQKVSTNDNTDYATSLERKLALMLSKMEGVGSVSVMVTIEVNEEKVLAENSTSQSQKIDERDQAGGTRMTDSLQQSNNVVLQNGNTPYIIKEYAPEIRGVFILAEGAEDTVIKQQIMDAVSKLLDVPVHKISVEKKKN